MIIAFEKVSEKLVYLVKMDGRGINSFNINVTSSNAPKMQQQFNKLIVITLSM